VQRSIAESRAQIFLTSRRKHGGQQELLPKPSPGLLIEHLPLVRAPHRACDRGGASAQWMLVQPQTKPRSLRFGYINELQCASDGHFRWVIAAPGCQHMLLDAAPVAGLTPSPAHPPRLGHDIGDGGRSGHVRETNRGVNRQKSDGDAA